MSLGPGPQFHPPELVWWNLLGSTAEVLASAAGPDCTELGAPTYEQGYDFPNFGNAVRIDQNGESIYAPSIADIFGQAAGCMECWSYNDGWTYLNGITSTAAIHPWWDQTEAGFTQRLHIRMTNAGVAWIIRGGGVQLNWTAAVPGATSGDQEWHHWAFVWDSLGIGGGAHQREIYFDGALASFNNVAIAGSIPTFSDGVVGHLGQEQADASPWVGRIDNIKWWDYAKTDFSDRGTEGYTPPPTPTVLTPECAVRREPTITVGGIDITDAVRETPILIEERQLKRSAVFPNDARLQAQNASNLFSLEHSRSILSGTNWQDMPVVVHDRWGFLLWDGLLSRPEVNHPKRETTLVTRSKLSRWKNEPVIYTSVGDETPAAALENIYAAMDFTDYDQPSLSRSKDVQAGMNIRVTLTEVNNLPFAQVIDRLCLYGVADAYEYLGKIYYIAWEQPFASTPAIVIDESSILDDPRDTRRTIDVINEYAIYESGTPSTVTDTADFGAKSRGLNGSVTLKDIASEADTIWDVRDVATAQRIGEDWMRRTHADAEITTPRIEIETRVRTEFRSWVNLGVDFGLTYSREEWTAKRFRVIGFKRDPNVRIITVRGLEW